MKHTPGPWRWSQNPHGGARVETPRVGIADVLSRAGVPHPAQESCAANARLIAAAPELLEALRGLVAEAKRLHVDDILGSSVDAARAALAKATGGDHD